MAVTLEYGKCDQCGDNNVKTAQVCRSCTTALPWARKEPKQAKVASSFSSSKDMSLPAVESGGLSTGFYVQIVGAIVTVAGAFLWIGNVAGFFPTFPGAGYIGLVIGGAIWRGGAGMD